ncbi:MAG: hypothetical protein ACC726_09860 [Chloroflexota bacterium]
MKVSTETASQLDAAIDSLLRGGPSLAVAGAEQDLTETARLLRDVLPRFHPRFGYEELFVRRIAVLGRDGAAPSEVSCRPGTAEPIAFPVPGGASSGAADERRRLGLVARGAIASGLSIAIPVAGAALVMWRRARSSGGLL